MSITFHHKPVPWWVILLLGATLWGGEYIRRDVWSPDEARYALISREMRDGHWLVPFRQGEYYSHKPPLIFWLTNAFSLLTGGEITNLTARLPSYLGAMMALWALTRLAARWFSAQAAWMTLILTPSAFLFWNKGGFGQIDMLLCGLEMMALYFLFMSSGVNSPGRLLLAYSFMGLGILAKGPVGFVVPLGIYIASSLAARETMAKPASHWVWGPLISLSFPAAWLTAAWLHGAPEGFFDEILFKQNVGRAIGEFGGHVKPFYYFLFYFPLDFLPWTLALPVSWLVLQRHQAYWAGRRRLFAWILFVVIFFSLSSSKRNLYILLAYPAAAMMVAAATDAWMHAPVKWLRWTFRAVRGLLLILGVGLCIGSFLPHVPFRAIFMLPAGVAMVAGAIWSGRIFQRDPFRPVWLAALAASYLGGYALIGALVYHEVNDLKTPDEIIDAAKTYLAPDERIIIYDWHGEIVSFYARRKGFMADDREELIRFILSASQPHHVIVTSEKNWSRIADLFPPGIEMNRFESGSKKLVWVKASSTQLILPGDGYEMPQ